MQTEFNPMNVSPTRRLRPSEVIEGIERRAFLGAIARERSAQCSRCTHEHQHPQACPVCGQEVQA